MRDRDRHSYYVPGGRKIEMIIMNIRKERRKRGKGRYKRKKRRAIGISSRKEKESRYQ